MFSNSNSFNGNSGLSQDPTFWHPIWFRQIGHMDPRLSGL